MTPVKQIKPHGGTLVNRLLAGTDHLSGQTVELLVRPEELELAPQRDALRGQPIGSGVIRRVGFAGPLERVSVQLQSPELQNQIVHALLYPGDTRRLGVHVNQQVWVGVREFHLLPNGAP